MARPNFDDFSEDELNDYLEKSANEDLRADNSDDNDTDDSEAIVYNDEPERIKISEPEDETPENMYFGEDKKTQREKDKAQKRFNKQREKLIRKHRKALRKNPSKVVRYDTDPINGLSKELVETRTIDGLVNENNTKTGKSIPKIIFTNLFTFFNILIFAIAGCLIAVGAYTDLVFLLIVTCNIIIGIIQEIRAKKMIDKLSLMSAPTAVVRRAGRNVEVQVNEVVLDDLILLENGQQICADSIVVDGSVEVNESLLTGESDAIIKKPGDVLYSGSFIVSGRCSARVDKIGKDNYIEELSSQAKKYKKPKSDLLFSLNFIIKFMTFPVLILGGALFYIMYSQNPGDLFNTVRKTAGAMIGMIPSGLFLMSSIALMIGVIRLGQRNVLVQELYCIEMLARVNCICLDKTGTITDGTMVVKNVIDYNTIYGLATKNIVSAMLNALHDNNLTSQALKDKFGLGKRIKHTAAIPFSSQRKYQAVTFDKYGTFILGAPEFVLREDFKRYSSDVNKYAALGYRVLCLAHKDGTIADGNLPSSNIEIVSMILIEDNIRPDAINTIKYFKESGVQVRVISGDNPITVSKISQRAGIDNADSYVSLDGMTDAEVIKAANKYTVFGRVSPAQKRLLIKTLKEEGLTVAMTGDGVNDILALREADCSIAVASGSEAARNCSHLVLVDSNFDSMPYVVSEGRRVINNVTTVSSLFLTKTIFSLFLAIQALISGQYPISTNQLILIETLAIGLPSLYLVWEPNNETVKGRFLYNVLKEALPGALTILVISILVFSCYEALSLDVISRNTIIVIAATHTCLMVLFKACRPYNGIKKGLCTLCYSLAVFAVIMLPQYLEIRPILPFAEYTSNRIEIETISKYPSIELSKANFFVVDGKVTSQQANINTKNYQLTAVRDEKDGKLYYAINDGVSLKKTDTLVKIPELSYAANGKIYFAGYKVENNNIAYNDDFESKLIIDEKGLVYYKPDDNTRIPVKIKLEKNSPYYDYSIKYGNVDQNDDGIRQFKVMPTVTSKNDEYVINGVQSNKYKYKIPKGYVFEDIRDFELSIGKEEGTGDYILLINGKPIYPTTSNGDVLTDKPYKVKLPHVSISTKNGKDTIYLDATDTTYSVFTLYGKYSSIPGTAEDATEKNAYTLKYEDDGVSKNVTYVEDDDKVYVDDELVENYRFLNLKSKGFTQYKDKSGKAININNLIINVDDNASSYSLYLNGEKKDLLKTGQLNNKFTAPTIETTKDGKYIINGYYTEYESSEPNLNPHKSSDGYLIIGGVKTDFKFGANDLISIKGGVIHDLDLAGKIFLVMLCLISAPLIKFFQNCVPWIIKQFRFVKEKVGSY